MTDATDRRRAAAAARQARHRARHAVEVSGLRETVTQQRAEIERLKGRLAAAEAEAVAAHAAERAADAARRSLHSLADLGHRTHAVLDAGGWRGWLLGWLLP